jgi:homeobox protein cut-like
VLSEDTVPKLNSEKEHLRRTVNRLTTQLEDTERRLEEERTARKQAEDNQEAKIKDVEVSWTAVLEEKTNNWEAKERSLEDKVENQERLLREIKASYEVTQRLGHDNDGARDMSRSTATAAELEIVSADLEKTSLRLAEIEARNEQLRIDLAQAVSQTKADKTSYSLEDDPAYQRLQSENSSLLRKLDSARLDKDSERHTWENETRQLERQFSRLTSEKEDLRRRLDQWADYEEIKRELEVIKVRCPGLDTNFYPSSNYVSSPLSLPQVMMMKVSTGMWRVWTKPST